MRNTAASAAYKRAVPQEIAVRQSQYWLGNFRARDSSVQNNSLCVHKCTSPMQTERSASAWAFGEQVLETRRVMKVVRGRRTAPRSKYSQRVDGRGERMRTFLCPGVTDIEVERAEENAAQLDPCSCERRESHTLSTNNQAPRYPRRPSR